MTENLDPIAIKQNLLERSVYKYNLNGTTWLVPFIKYGLDKVIDWKRDDVWAQNPSAGTALISARKQDRFNECQLKPVNDKSGIRIGWGAGEIDRQTGLPSMGTYKIDQLSMELNLAIPDQQKLYFFIATNPMVLGSPNCWVQTNAMLEIVDKNSDAKKNIDLRDKRIDAVIAAREITDENQIKDLVMVFEDVAVDTPPIMLKDILQTYADKHPVEFMDLINSKDRPYLVVFSKAETMHVIQYDLEHGFMFGDVRLGLSKEEVVDYMKKNPEMYRAVGNGITREESGVTSHNETGSSSKTMSVQVDERLVKENESLKGELNDLASTVAQMQQMMKEMGASPEEKKDSVQKENIKVEVTNKKISEMNHEELVSLAIDKAWPQEEWSQFSNAKDMLGYIEGKETPVVKKTVVKKATKKKAPAKKASKVPEELI